MRLLLVLVMLPIITGIILYAFKFKYERVLAFSVQSILLLVVAYLSFLVFPDGLVSVNLTSVPPPYGMALEVDQLSAIMLILNNTLMPLLLLFNYFKPYMNHMFVFLFLLLQGLMNAIFISGDLFNIYILIEVSTALVSILIMFKRDSRSIYDGIIYLMINLVGMAFFLFGIAYLYKYLGVLDLRTISSKMALITDAKTMVIPFAFLFTGASLKCALMPLFSWLPRAHATPSAPSIVSAMLSGLFVKTGVYLFIRLYQIFENVLYFREIFLIFGLVSAIFGFIMAVAQSDIKLILSYHTISQIGLIMAGLNIGNNAGYHGALMHILNHGFFKATLLLTAGIAIEIFGTRNIYEMKGLFKKSRYTSFAILIASLGISGFPLFSGGFSKSLITKGFDSSFTKIFIIIASVGTLISFIKFSSIVFGKSTSNEQNNHIQVDTAMKVVLGILSTIIIVTGIMGSSIFKLLFGKDSPVDIAYQSFHIFEFILMALVSYAIYIFISKHKSILQSIRQFDLSFNSVVLVVTVFFGFLLASASIIPV